MVQFIDLKKGDILFAINLDNKTLELLVITKTPYIDDFGCCKALIIPTMSSYINGEYSDFIIDLDKSKQSISFEDTDRFIFISDKKVLKYFINLRD